MVPLDSFGPDFLFCLALLCKPSPSPFANMWVRTLAHCRADSCTVLSFSPQDFIDTEMLLCAENVNQDNLLSYAREAADFATNYQLPSLDFALNHYGQPDVAMFDFTSMYASENAALVRERQSHQLLVALVGDSLLEVAPAFEPPLLPVEDRSLHFCSRAARGRTGSLPAGQTWPSPSRPPACTWPALSPDPEGLILPSSPHSGLSGLITWSKYEASRPCSSLHRWSSSEPGPLQNPQLDPNFFLTWGALWGPITWRS